MNENKIKLILKIATSLSDEQCRNILERIEQSPEVICNKLVNLCNELNKDWDESKHPRADDGRFSTTGSMRSQMLKSETKKWDKIGHSTPSNPTIVKKKSELKKAIENRDNAKTDVLRNVYERQVVNLQREIANLEREAKRTRRMKLEEDISERILKKRVKEYEDTELELDYMEEKYADRTPDSPTQGDVVFPKSKNGEKAKQKYERLKQRLVELDDEIDWDKIHDDLTDSVCD